MIARQLFSEAARRWDPARFAREVLGFHPDPRQAALLGLDSRRCLLACHRQWGKSTTAAAKAIHHAVHLPDSLTLIVAPTLRQGSMLLGVINRFARKLGLSVKGDPANRPSLAFPNGARVVAVPSDEDNIRGFSAVSLLLIDEAARVPDDVWHAVLPMVSTVDGAIFMMSTPKGREGFFAAMWHDEDPAWDRVIIRADESGRIAPNVLDSQRACMTAAEFAQEYLCEFSDAAGRVFSTGEINAAFDNSVEPLPESWNPSARVIWPARTQQFAYFIGLDLGQHQDYTAISVVELHTFLNGCRDAYSYDLLADTTLRVRHLERLPLGTPYTRVLAHVTGLAERLGPRACLVVDASGLGAPFVDFLRTSRLRLWDDTPSRMPRIVNPDGSVPDHGYLMPITITSGGQAGPAPGSRKGWLVPKLDLIETLQRMLESKRIEISPNLKDAPVLRAELAGLRREGDSFEPASARTHDDLVMSLALAAWRISRCRKDLLSAAPEPARGPA